MEPHIHRESDRKLSGLPVLKAIRTILSSFFPVLLFLLVFRIDAQAQMDSTRRHRVAIFTPLYLDSAFDATGNYRYDKNFPKFINPGLEFYEGVSMAIDTLQMMKVRLDIRIYDTRSSSNPITRILQSPEFDSTELIIGHVNVAELRELANAAQKRKIPFINVNFPNDGGVTNNPELVILNSTLKTHCEALYKFVQRNWGTSTINYFYKAGGQEDRLRGYFSEIEKNTASVPLKMRYIPVSDPADPNQFIPYLDSLRKTICIVGSLDENYARTISASLSSLNKTYVTKILGMPTWDNIAEFSQPAYDNQEVYYTSPFYINPSDSLVLSISNIYRNKFYSRPSDMIFRGYESIMRFGRLLGKYGQNLSGSIGEKRYKVFDDFDIQPVFLNRQTMVLDYFENKKLYIIKKVNGIIVAVY
ncbi:MAG: amino acid ABC transporter substrate-binding protein [Chitinophagales bacterium]